MKTLAELNEKDFIIKNDSHHNIIILASGLIKIKNYYKNRVNNNNQLSYMKSLIA